MGGAGVLFPGMVYVYLQWGMLAGWGCEKLETLSGGLFSPVGGVQWWCPPVPSQGLFSPECGDAAKGSLPRDPPQGIPSGDTPQGILQGIPTRDPHKRF
jgi:hypothetical protein